MCHWALRVWKCGESSFTKQSPCSFDRAACPNNPLNPLHPSIKLLTHGESSAQSSTNDLDTLQDREVQGIIETQHGQHCSKSRNTTRQSRGAQPQLCRFALNAIDNGTPKYHHRKSKNDGAQTASRTGGKPEDNRHSTTPQSAVGKESQKSSPTYVKEKCHVFEVVLQRLENTVCPACARSPRRAALPAHARGCFGLS
ncbi:hypothetical protein SVAN01_10360 [Stagonosporopsis vannaccii]|nr:hypothetical protein SVAN01_10360 [Stagonosporopsis vannaccii]